MPPVDVATCLKRLAILMPIVWLTGCPLLHEPAPGPTTSLSLSPVVPPREGVELMIAWVRRPAADPILGDALWSELNQIGSSDILRRDKLLQSGIRYGLAGNNPPLVLTALIDERYETPSHRDTTLQQRMIPSGSEAALETWAYPDGCRVEVNGRERELVNARCIMRIRAEKTQEGWATLHCVPEIHHGESAGRFVPHDLAFRYHQGQQEVWPLYDHAFSVDLNRGESVVIGPTSVPASLGRHFFQGGEEGHATRGVLIIRLTSIRRVDPVLMPRE